MNYSISNGMNGANEHGNAIIETKVCCLLLKKICKHGLILCAALDIRSIRYTKKLMGKSAARNKTFP